jgi:Sec-independent protein translocase protein TatA
MLLFLDISAGELLIIFVAFLLLFGPKSIPSLAQNLGRFIFYARQAKEDIQKEVFKSTEKINYYIQTTRQEVEQNIVKDQEVLREKKEDRPEKIEAEEPAELG